MIYSLDTYEFNKNPEKIFTTLIDFNTYKHWWPFFIKFKNIETTNNFISSKMIVQPILSPSFLWEIISINDMEIKIRYASGAYLGIGIWKLSKQNDKILLSYEVKLNINNLVINLTSKIISIEKIHKKLMTSVFKKLDNYL